MWYAVKAHLKIPGKGKYMGLTEPDFTETLIHNIAENGLKIKIIVVQSIFRFLLC